jgi:hypothetical protein
MDTVKPWVRRIVREWERACLWASSLLFALLVAVQLAALLPQEEISQPTPARAKAAPSYLNAETAFAFLHDRSAAITDGRNPFAFSIRLPEPPPAAVQATVPGATTPVSALEAEAGPLAPPPALAVETPPLAAEPDPAVSPAPLLPAKRTASVLYKGLYRGGTDAVQQVAFLSAHETPGGTLRALVLGEGQSAAGVTVRRLTSSGIVVAGPTGEEVTIGIGQQASVALE